MIVPINTIITGYLGLIIFKLHPEKFLHLSPRNIKMEIETWCSLLTKRRYREDCPATLVDFFDTMGILAEEGHEGMKIAKFKSKISEIQEKIVSWDRRFSDQNIKTD